MKPEASGGWPAPSAELLQPSRALTLQFWVCMLAADVVLLLSLSKITLLATYLAGAVLLAGLVLNVEWTLALVFLGVPFLAPLQLRGDGATWALMAGRGLFALAAWIALRRSGCSVARAIARALANPAMIAVLLLTLLIWVNLARSMAPEYGTGKLKSFVVANVFLFAAPLVLWPQWAQPRALDRFLRAAVVIGAAFAAVGAGAALGVGGALGIAGADRAAPAVGARLAWLGADPIWTARLLAIWLVVLVWAGARRTIRPLLAVLLAAGGLVLILRTGSRGPLVALLLSPAALLVMPRPAGARRLGTLVAGLRIAIPAVLLVAAALSLILPASARTTLLAAVLRGPLGARAADGAGGAVVWDAGERLLQDPSVVFRLEMVRRSLAALADALPWGAGTGSFPALLFLRDFRLYPHNAEVELLIEQGIGGLLLFAVLLGFAFVCLRHLVRRDASLYALGALLAMAFLNAQVSGDITGNSEIWFWAGMAAGLKLAADHPLPQGI